MSTFLTLYNILKVSDTASSDEIKSSFRKLAKIYHPDKNENSVESKIEFITIHNAYKILTNSEKRDEYDNYIAKKINNKRSTPNSTHQNNISKANSKQYAFSIEQITNHINFVVWDIEIFLNTGYKNYFDREIGDITIQQYILNILIFIDKWILFPSGYHDYFMEARQKNNIDFSNYPDMFNSQNKSFEHKPFFSIINYFYDIRKRIDKLLNNIKIKDLYVKIPDSNIFIIDSIIEAQNYSIHYMNNLDLFLAGKTEKIESFKHSNPYFIV